MKNNQYDHKKIEKKWQGVWDKTKIFQAKDFSKKPKFFGLIEFPYPSGDGLHVGHVRSNTAMDVIAHKRRGEGYNVLYPIGWDAFGLPSENYAIKTGIHPTITTKKNIKTFTRQLKSMGFSFDWSREINTTDPKYYKWTQWMFLQFYKNGLAYRDKIEINWCPKDKIGLANEEVIDGCCERCGTKVEKREKEQWMLAITKYADRLATDVNQTDYLDKIKTQQKNWIGKSEGAEIEFRIIHPSPALPEGKGEKPGYHTADSKSWFKLQEKALEMRNNPTKAEEIMWEMLRKHKEYHFRRQHIIDNFIADFVCLSKKVIIEIDGDVHDSQHEKDSERTGVLETLGYQILRFRNEEVINEPKKVYQSIIESVEKAEDFKILPFGEDLGGVNVFTTRPETLFGVTYVVIAPDHPLLEKVKSEITNYSQVQKFITLVKSKAPVTDRTSENKDKTGIELEGIYAIHPATKERLPVWIGDYVLSSYGTGAVMAVPAHDERDFEFAKKYNLPIRETEIRAEDKSIFTEKYGKPVTTFKLRDWVFSRQRYWGEPIPLIHCEKCDWVPVPEKDLPVKLPNVRNYEPTDSGESPLAMIDKWVNTKCPKCGGKAKRETDTMPNWAGSSWYFLRYMDPKNSKTFADPKKLAYWGQVDWYNGGMEHTNLHLLYSRFWHKFLYDIKVVPYTEPYKKRTSHGFILASNNEKMSKSRGNVVNPDTIIATYGADSLRLYEMFIGPFDQAASWNEESIIGVRRFIEKVWRLKDSVSKSLNSKEKIPDNPVFEMLLHKTILKVSEDIESVQFNTCISSLMILANEFEKQKVTSRKNYEILLRLLAPFAPHVTEQIFHELGHKKSIHLEPWPKADLSKTVSTRSKYAVQVNGKTRGFFETEKNKSDKELEEMARNMPEIVRWISGKEVKKVIIVKEKLVSIVVKEDMV
jgi:leucyl-tRNA synthetase